MADIIKRLRAERMRHEVIPRSASLGRIAQGRPRMQPVITPSVSVGSLGSTRPNSGQHQREPTLGVSAAHVATFAGVHGGVGFSTRAVAHALKLEAKQTGAEGPLVDRIAGDVHFITGQAIVGAATVHVVHAWDSTFREVGSAVLADCAGDVDKKYSMDFFSLDQHAHYDDPVTTLHSLLEAVPEVVLVLDAQASALKRLWVLFESLVAFDLGKLRIRCSSPSGFGDSQESLRTWQHHVDSVDWVLAETTKAADDKRIRGFVQRQWTLCGKDVERKLALLRKFLRREIYGQIAVAAVMIGNKATVAALLEAGIDPGRMDEFGNTLEELASSCEHPEVEEMLFEHRMRKLNHLPLSAFFGVREMMKASECAAESVLQPFLTEPSVEEPLLSDDEVPGENSGKAPEKCMA